MELKPGYKLTEVGVIPEDWEVSCVGDSFDVCNELRLPISQSVRERMAGPYPYYGPTNIQGWINEYRVEGKYALIGEDGDHFLKWRNQAMTLLVSGQFNVNNHAHLVCGRENLTEWFYWFFSNRDLIPYLTRQGASRYKLKKATLLKMPCALPPLPEQRSIATALSDMDELLGGLDRLINKKRDLKQSAMQQLLTGKTRLPGFGVGENYKQTEVGVIPETWEIQTLGKISTISRLAGAEYTSFWTETVNGEIIALRGFNIGKGKIVERDLVHISNKLSLKLKRSRLCKGDVVYPCVGSIGNAVAITEDCKYHIQQNIARITPKPCVINSCYLVNFLMSTLAVKEVERFTSSSSQPSILVGSLRQYRILLPPTLEEQNAISSILSDMDTEIATLEQRRNKTRDLKQAMMQELLTGRIRLL
jgi:type I restriction enzyme, S subunit